MRNTAIYAGVKISIHHDTHLLPTAPKPARDWILSSLPVWEILFPRGYGGGFGSALDKHTHTLYRWPAPYSMVLQLIYTRHFLIIFE